MKPVRLAVEYLLLAGFFVARPALVLQALAFGVAAAAAWTVTSSNLPGWVAQAEISAAVLSATAAYLEGEDLFGQWLADDYDVDHGNSWKWEAVGQLFDSWTTYATRAGEKPGSKKAFSQAMQNRGFASSEQGHAKVRAFTGLRLKASGRPQVQ